MERLPLVKEFCAVALRMVCAHVESASFRANGVQVAALRQVLGPSDLRAVEEERFAQSRCGSVVCRNAVDKDANAARPRVAFDEATGDLVDVSHRMHFCSRECSEAAATLEASLDANPAFLRSGIVEKMVIAARDVGLSYDAVRTIERLAQPLLPKQVVIREEEEGEKKQKVELLEKQPKKDDGGDALGMTEEGVKEGNDFDVMELMDWDDEDKKNLATRVEVPLVPLVWDLLGQWVTVATKTYVATGELVESVSSEERSVLNLKGHSLVQRRTRLSQSMGPVLKSLLAGCEVEDAEEVALLVGRVDNLILTLNVTAEHAVATTPGARFDYTTAANACFGSKGLKVIGAAFAAVLRPKLIKDLCEQLSGVKQYELEMLKDVFY